MSSSIIIEEKNNGTKYIIIAVIITIIIILCFIYKEKLLSLLGLEISKKPTPTPSITTQPSTTITTQPSTTPSSTRSSTITTQPSTTITTQPSTTITTQPSTTITTQPSNINCNYSISETSCNSNEQKIVTKTSSNCPTLTETVDCDVDCIISDYRNTTCNPETGTYTRTWDILRQSKGNGKKCPTENSVEVKCRVNCELNPFGPYGPCINGKKTRRATKKIVEKNGGVCYGLEETVNCTYELPEKTYSYIDVAISSDGYPTYVAIPSPSDVIGNLKDEKIMYSIKTGNEWNSYKWVNSETNLRNLGINRLSSITYGNGMFVAVGNGIIISKDKGITWKKIDNIPNKFFSSIVYSDTFRCFFAFSYDERDKNFIGMRTKDSIRSADGFFYTIDGNKIVGENGSWEEIRGNIYRNIPNDYFNTGTFLPQICSGKWINTEMGNRNEEIFIMYNMEDYISISKDAGKTWGELIKLDFNCIGMFNGVVETPFNFYFIAMDAWNIWYSTKPHIKSEWKKATLPIKINGSLGLTKSYGNFNSSSNPFIIIDIGKFTNGQEDKVNILYSKDAVNWEVTKGPGGFWTSMKSSSNVAIAVAQNSGGGGNEQNLIMMSNNGKDWV